MFPEADTYVVKVDVKLERRWNEEYENEDSDEYKQLIKAIRPEVTSQYMHNVCLSLCYLA